MKSLAAYISEVSAGNVSTVAKTESYDDSAQYSAAEELKWLTKDSDAIELLDLMHSHA